MANIILIDGNSIMFRCFHATNINGSIMQNSQGVYTNALFGFIGMTEKIIKNTPYVLVAFDSKEKTFRHLDYPAYKGTRKPIPEELVPQIDLIYEYLDLKGIKRLNIPGYEADDIIGSYAKKFGTLGNTVDVYTSDKDLLQLISPYTYVNLIKSGTKDIKKYDSQIFKEDYQIDLSSFIDLKAIMGDASDNIKGIAGVGVVGATNMLKTYGNIENIYANIDSFKGKLKENLINGESDAYFSRKLVTINTDIVCDYSLDNLKVKTPNTTLLSKFYTKYELYTYKKNLDTSKINENIDTKSASEESLFNDSPICVTSKKELSSILKGIRELAVYASSSSSNYHKSSILGFGICTKNGCYYFSKDIGYECETFIDVLENINIKKNVFNYKELYVLLKYDNIFLRGVDFDLLLASYLINTNLGKEDIVGVAAYFNYTNFQVNSNENEKLDLFNCSSDFKELDIVLAKNALAINELKNKLLKLLEENNQSDLLNNIEIPLSKVLADMEISGLKVDINSLSNLQTFFSEKLALLEEKIVSIAGETFNIKSPKQVSNILFNKLKLPNFKNKSESTNHDILEQLKDEHEIVPLILEYREYSKLLSTYIESIPSKLDSSSLIHTIYTQTITNTGRLSSIEPNLQNIPTKTAYGREIKKIYISKDNYTFLGYDYSQIELRILSHTANVNSLIESFNEDADIHSETAKVLFNTNQPTSDERRRAKTINFGIIYGLGPKSLANDLDITYSKAKEYIDNYFQIYPQIKEYMDKTINFVKEKGYVSTLFNRRRYIEEASSTNKNIQNYAFRAAINAPIQGTSADIIKIAMVRIDKYLKDNNYKSHLVLTIHDELIIEALDSEIDDIKFKIEEIMTNVIKLSVPLKTSFDEGKSWYDLK
ncbi:MAG: DNA polymerase I [Acholeplasmatales bacterium]|jgi:DNA polymerase-1|nr:DNA polymerase I [Acholeplasmatales bacterium]